jgi:predicted ATP-dependent endonuclease of OLD family
MLNQTRRNLGIADESPIQRFGIRRALRVGRNRRWTSCPARSCGVFMPKILSIAISNFKGAKKVSIDLSERVKSPVITLVGLNESGKTTILEGLSYFVTGDNAVSSLFAGVHSRSTTESLIPIHRKAAFSDKIRISASVSLSDDDYEAASRLARKHRQQIDKASFPNKIDVSRIYEFEDSVLKNHSNTWGLDLKVKSAQGKRWRELSRPTNEEEGKPDLWLEIVEDIRSRLQRIAYFPTFLVDMPTRIYLKEHPDERPVNRYYRYVLQDILDSLGEGLSLEKHVSKRIDDFKAKEDTANWFSILFGGPSKAPIDSVFQKISNAVTKEVLGSWRRVFQRPIAAKSISVEWHIDTQKGDLPYAAFYVSDGESKYAISERSLGFRWFFSFLLFTAFKQASTRSTLFVFDEPAANLHAKAQAELLTSFARITSGNNQVVYSTHSHHMINPRWLSGAYIVENTALDYDADDAFALTTKPTNIIATKYREFVSQHPTRTSYFQPVIEKLEYVTPEIVGSAPFLIVEGITDYYALKFAKNKSSGLETFSIMPGNGAGAAGPLISLLLGRGERFLLLLDDDRAGKMACEKYKEEWFLSESTVQTLGDLHSKFKGMTLERLLSPNTKKMIQSQLQRAKSPSKKEIGLYLSEMSATGAASPFSKETEGALLEVLTFAATRLQ